MGNATTRLIAEKQRVIQQVCGELGLEPEVTAVLKVRLMPALLDRGYEVRMLGGDRVWWQDEEPPGAEEIRTWTAPEVAPMSEEEFRLFAEAAGFDPDA